jgi:hypothetical protein
MHPNTKSVAQRFASLLDGNDIAAVGCLLAENCEYKTRAGTLVGRESILESYRETNDWAKANLHEVIYESRVIEVNVTSASVLFIDKLRHKGLSHTYECVQRVTLNQRRIIEHIEHIELPGRREALSAFLQSVGISRP